MDTAAAARLSLTSAAPASVALLLALAAPATAGPPAGGVESFAFPPFGTVRVYAPARPPQQVVLFVSGDGGWNLGVIPMARRLSAEGALVVGIDVRALLAGLERSGSCAYPAGSLEQLARAVQLRQRLPEYHAPDPGRLLLRRDDRLRGARAGPGRDLPWGDQPRLLPRRRAEDAAVPGPRPRLATARAGGLAASSSPSPASASRGPCCTARSTRSVRSADAARFVSRDRLGPAGRRCPRSATASAVTSRWEEQYVEAYRKLAARGRAGGRGERARAGSPTTWPASGSSRCPRPGRRPA